MSKHRTRSELELIRIMEKDIEVIDRARSFRLRVIIDQLHKEYLVKEIIRISMKGKRGIKEKINELTFGKHIQLIGEWGIFDKQNKMKKKLIKLSEIRNHYAHNLTNYPSKLVKNNIEWLFTQYKNIFPPKVYKNKTQMIRFSKSLNYQKKYRMVTGRVLGELRGIYYELINKE
jgi:hypothetical protein